jgi:hypothetical protein
MLLNKEFLGFLMMMAKRILILGLAKSGTTALHFKIKNSLEKGTIELFEPDMFIPKEEYKKQDIVAKVIVDHKATNFTSFFNNFDKKILIVRDPRDLIISKLLFYKLQDIPFAKRKLKKFLTALQKKEDNPEDIPLSYVIKSSLECSFEEWLKILENKLDFLIALANLHKDVFVIKYEDLIDGKVKKLEKFLGFKLVQKTKISEKYQKVVRSKRYGNWKNWFTQEDILIFRPIFKKYMKKFNYADKWKANKIKKINKKESSEYVIKRVNQYDRDIKTRTIRLLRIISGILRKNIKSFGKFRESLRFQKKDPIRDDILREIKRPRQKAL